MNINVYKQRLDKERKPIAVKNLQASISHVKVITTASGLTIASLMMSDIGGDTIPGFVNRSEGLSDAEITLFNKLSNSQKPANARIHGEFVLVNNKKAFKIDQMIFI